MSATEEEIKYTLECNVAAMYADIILTGFMTKDGLLDEIERMLAEHGA